MVQCKNNIILRFLDIAQQTAAHSNIPENEATNNAIFDLLSVIKVFFQIDESRYFKNKVEIKCEQTEYVDQRKGLKVFCEE